jgi:hypothetical protein
MSCSWAYNCVSKRACVLERVELSNWMAAIFYFYISYFNITYITCFHLLFLFLPVLNNRYHFQALFDVYCADQFHVEANNNRIINICSFMMVMKYMYLLHYSLHL